MSKAYSLIDRFSEDIDLLVLPDPDLGEQVDLIMDKMTALAVEALGPGAICTNLEAVPGNSRRVNLGLPLRTVRASPALGMLNVPGLLGDIVADCHAVTSRWFSDGSPTPTLSNLADSPAFTDAAVGLRIRGAYDTACRDLCHPGTAIPPWDEVVATVSEQRHLLQA